MEKRLNMHPHTYASDVYLVHGKKLPLRDNEFVKPTFHVAGCMGFVRVNAFSFFHCVASPFHSFVTTFHIPSTHSTETFLHRKRVPFAQFTIPVVYKPGLCGPISTEQLACYLLRTLVHGKPARSHGIASKVRNCTSRYDYPRVTCSYCQGIYTPIYTLTRGIHPDAIRRDPCRGRCGCPHIPMHGNVIDNT